jgi:tRNA dimethylallyltransferase
MKKLVAIIGPTGIGKSSLALELAKKLDGEIISADSRQVYRLMDIGTAKSTTLERQGIPHHAIDVVFPDESFSLADFVDIANNEIDLVHGRGRVPILEGGTGQYVWAIIEGWEIPRIKPDNSFRKELEDRALKDGGEVLYEELAKINPVLSIYSKIPGNLMQDDFLWWNVVTASDFQQSFYVFLFNRLLATASYADNPLLVT